MGDRLQLAAGESRATVDPDRGGRLTSLAVDGLELLRTGDGTNPMAEGCFPMAPWAGRVRRGRFHHDGTEWRLPIDLPPHAIHGTVYARPWAVEAAGADTVEMRTGLGASWPFPGWAVQHVRLAPGALHLRLEVHTDGPAFPASCGWHPWWRRRLERGGPAELHIEASAMWQRDEEGIPDGTLVPPGRRPWDDCFTDLHCPPVLRWPGALELTIDSGAGHLVVFDEPDDAVCVEPQTGPPDALNLMPAVVTAGHPLVAEATIAWRTTTTA
ncbi:MAG TPA: hypothetical protein VMN58_13460 [Acidimicrobiales bacterium]|nr:hypothetical protein [Acidimicrobiales bacterium]